MNRRPTIRSFAVAANEPRYQTDRPAAPPLPSQPDPSAIADLAKLLGVRVEVVDWSTLAARTARRDAMFLILSGGALC